MKLRPYQTESIDSLFAYWGASGGNGLLVLPTGAGKSLVLASICKTLLSSYPDMRIGIVTHVKELVQQNAQELMRLWPGAPLGIYSAGVGRRDTRAKILFMGIQSVHNRINELGGFDVLLVDEAHLIPKNSDTMYGRFLAACLDKVCDMRLVGLTATPYRLDSGRLDGKGSLFNEVVYDANVRDLIAEGYLCPLISKATLAQINTQGLHKRAGEFIQAEMDARARIPTVIEAAVSEIVKAGVGRYGWLIFCTGVEHAKEVCAEVKTRGITCETITGDTPAGERDRLIRDYKAKKIRCLTSVGVLTTGFNAPHVDLVALLRPTLSTGLYIQMVGRAFRPLYADGFDLQSIAGRVAAIASGLKPNALILDFAGNITRHGPVDAVSPKKQGGGKKREEKEEKDEDDDVRAKACPACKTLVEPSTLICPGCGFEWPPAAPKHKAEAEDVSILSGERPESRMPKDVPIKGCKFSRHQKDGLPDSMRVSYDTTMHTYVEWVCFEHLGFVGERARTWWLKAGGAFPPPKTVTEALERIDVEIGQIQSIKVRKEGKYDRVASVMFEPGPYSGPARAKIENPRDPDPFAKAAGGYNEDGPFGKAYARGNGRRATKTPEQLKAETIIWSLKEKTVGNGCTAPEAAAAAAKVDELIAKHGLRAIDFEEIPF